MTRAAKPRRLVRVVALIAVAVIVAIVPLPAAAVERYYSLGLYPVIQRLLTPASNLVSVALLDLAAIAVVVFLVFRLVRAGWRAAGLALLSTAAIIYLVFVALWGMNYRR